jgi:hypothetical protein
VLRDAKRVEDLDGGAHAAVLSDSLLSAYCVLRDLAEEAFGGDAPGRGSGTHSWERSWPAWTRPTQRWSGPRASGQPSQSRSRAGVILRGAL